MGEIFDNNSVVSIVKNERDIISDFLDQILELFDTIVLVDHGSQDGTYEICRNASDRFPSISLYRLHSSGFPQDAVNTLLYNHLFTRIHPRWLFFLDADEFLPFSRREDFVKALTPHAGAEAIEMKWRNMVPEPFGDWTGIRHSRFVTAAGHTSPYVKIALALPAFKKHGKRLTVWMGSHGATTETGEKLSTEHTEFELCHLPFRSKLQAQFKIIKGKISKLGSLRATPGISHHQDAMLDSYLSAPDDFLAAIPQLVLSYGEHSFETTPREKTFVGSSFSYPWHTGDTMVSPPVIPTVALLWKDIERLDNLWRKRFARTNGEVGQEAAFDAFLLTTKDGQIADLSCDERAEAPVSMSGLETAPAAEAAGAVVAGVARMGTEIRESYALGRFLSMVMTPPLSLLEENEWVGHAGFLHALIGVARPTQVVQVGLRGGYGLLTVCESLRYHDVSANVVGLDPWRATGTGSGQACTGDHEFVEYSRRLQRFPFARLIRSSFDEGRRCIPEGAVDLLIFGADSGCGGELAEFSPWISALSRQSVCLFFGNTGAVITYNREQEWREVTDRWPYLEFSHGRGLGVLFTGEEQHPDIQELIRIWSGSTMAAEGLRTSIEALANNHSLHTRCAEIEQQATATHQQLARLGANLLTKEDQVRSLEAEVTAIRASRIWRWTTPLRVVLDRFTRAG